MINKQIIENVIKDFEKTREKYGYNNFEIALLIYLRGDIEIFDKLTNKDLEELEDLTCADSILDIDRDDVDEILDKYL